MPSNDITAGDIVGFVDAAVEATTNTFHVVLAEDATAQLDDLVVMRSTLPNGDEVIHYGIVVEVEGCLDGAQLSSDTIRIVRDRTMPGEVCRRAEIQVLRTDPERWVPPDPGAEVRHAVAHHRDMALFTDKMEGRLPVGVDQAGQPVEIDFTFLNGVKGAHTSISGISGVATKTSFATSLLYHIFETERGRGLLGMRAPDARAIVFNVKGEDLLHLDRANGHFDTYPDARAQWAAMGVPQPGPFERVAFYVPRMPGGHDDGIVPNVTQRNQDEVTVFGWTPEQFVRRGLIQFCLEDEGRGSQVPFVEQRVRLELARRFLPVAGHPGAIVLRDPVSTSTDWERAASAPRQAVAPEVDEPVIENFRDLVEFLMAALDPAQTHPQAQAWQGNLAAGSLMAFSRRVSAQVLRMGHLVGVGLRAVRLDTEITVVDIHTLHDSAQRFTVGAILSEIFESKQREGREPLRFVVLDELNKYAPRQGDSPIKDLLVDIAARGRSLGVILIGAQQSAGDVDATVTRNAAIKVVGRLDAAETDDYRFLSPQLRERASRFLPGTMVLHQPIIPAAIPIRFPFPGFATRREEAEAAMLARLQDDASLGALFEER